MLLWRRIRLYFLKNTSTKQTIVKNTFWLLVAEGMSKGSFFIISVLIARQIGPKEFGIMSFVMSFVSMFIILTDFGLTTLMIRDVSKDESKLGEYFVNGSFLKIILGFFTFGLVRCVSLYIGKSDFYTSLILIYCGYSIINNIGEFIRAFFRPSEHMQYEALLKIINGVLAIIIIGGTLLMGYTLVGIFCAYLITGAISLLVSVGFVIGRKKITLFKLSKIRIKQLIGTGALLLSGMLASSRFLYVDQIFVGFFRSETELGYYAAAYKIVGFIVLCASLMASVLYPKMVRLGGEKTRIRMFLQYISKIILLGSTVFIIINLLISHRIIPFVFGQNYIQSIAPYNILVFITIFALLNNILGNLLIIHNKEKEYLISVILALIINVILNIVFIPVYGIIAAAIITVVTEGICLGLYYYFNRKYII